MRMRKYLVVGRICKTMPKNLFLLNLQELRAAHVRVSRPGHRALPGYHV